MITGLVIGLLVLAVILMLLGALHLRRVVAVRNAMELRAFQAEAERDAWRDTSEHWTSRADYYQDRLNDEITRHHGTKS